MRIDLTRAWSRILFLGLILVCSGTFIFFSGRAYLAAHWNATSNLALRLKAARLEPGNAEYWGRLGASHQWDLSSADIQQAVHYLEKATRLNPRSADLWMELADAYQTSGDAARAREAYAKAQESYPISAEVAWRYGSFLVYEGAYSEGYTEFRRALSVDPTLATDAISECWQSSGSVVPILDNVLPRKSGYYIDAMNFFLSQNLTEPALAVWNRRQELNLPVKMSETVPLVDALIAEDRLADAQRTWSDGLDGTNWGRDEVENRSLVMNSGFERHIANGGFDWREIAIDGVRFNFDNFLPHSGSRSLRIQFDGTKNLDFQNLFQLVPVKPGTRYHFSAYLRSQAISTDHGVHFEILDAKHPVELQVVTPDAIGTTPWILQQTDFVTRPNTHLLRISLRRIPSWKFDNKLGGTVWVDDVALTPSPGIAKDIS
jgi:hypothetical protein